MWNAGFRNNKCVSGEFVLFVGTFNNVAFVDEFRFRNSGADDFVVDFSGEIINEESSASN